MEREKAQTETVVGAAHHQRGMTDGFKPSKQRIAALRTSSIQIRGEWPAGALQANKERGQSTSRLKLKHSDLRFTSKQTEERGQRSRGGRRGGEWPAGKLACGAEDGGSRGPAGPAPGGRS